MTKKMTYTDNQYRKIFEESTNHVKFERIEELRKIEREKMMEFIGTRKAGFGWSGGKDSVVLAHFCKGLGFKSMIGISQDLEYSKFEDFIEKEKPEGCEIYRNKSQSYAWLKEHEQHLFVPNSYSANWWAQTTQRNLQDEFAEDNDIEVMVYGRRLDDGNFCGRSKKKYYTTKNSDFYKYLPFKYWNHYETLAYIKYYDLKLPFFYTDKKFIGGFLSGPERWCSPIPPKVNNHLGIVGNYLRVFFIEPTIINKAIKYDIKGAKLFKEKLRLKGIKGLASEYDYFNGGNI